jgi:hypothetical protein
MVVRRASKIAEACFSSIGPAAGSVSCRNLDGNRGPNSVNGFTSRVAQPCDPGENVLANFLNGAGEPRGQVPPQFRMCRARAFSSAPCESREGDIRRVLQARGWADSGALTRYATAAMQQPAATAIVPPLS